VKQAVQQAAAMHQMHQQGASGGDYAAGLSGGDMILPPEIREALASYGVGITQLHGRPVDVWGRMIRHSDGSYTESKEDLANDSLEQVTKSRNGVVLQRRLISLDQMKRPSEVLVYNGRGEFRYRGVLVYDQFNRFQEEQLYDAQGTLMRRKVQEYTPDGHKRPLRSWDYVANVPDDLKLIVLRETEEVETRAVNSGAATERRPLFRSRQQANAAASRPSEAPPAQPAPPAQTSGLAAQPIPSAPAHGAPPANSAPPASAGGMEAVPAQVAADDAGQQERRGLNLGRMFGNRNR